MSKNPLKPPYARWEMVLVCDHPLVDRIYQMGGLRAASDKPEEFIRVVFKGGTHSDFPNIEAVNFRLNEIDKLHQQQKQ